MTTAAPTARGVDVLERARHRWTPDRLACQYDPAFVRYRHSVMMGLQFRRLVTKVDPWQIWTFQPQIGKSEMAVRKGPIWAHDFDPTLRIISASYAVSLAQKSTRYCRNVAREHGGGVLRHKVDPTRSAMHEWNTTEGGSMLAVGVGGSIIGNPADGLLLDDLHKNWFEAHQAGQRQKVWEWLISDAYSRLQDDAWGLIVSTRWHPDDVIGRAQEEVAPNGKPFSVFHVPAIADSTLTPDGDPLGRKNGEVVEPRRFKKTTMLHRERVAGPFIWNAEYQGNPRIAEGSVLRRDWFRWRKAMPRRNEALAFVTSWDCTFEETDDGSFVVGQAWCLTPEKPHRFVLYDQVRGRWDYPSFRNEFLAFRARHPEASAHLIEKSANGPALAAELEGQGVDGITLVGVNLSKYSRAVQVSPLLADGRVELAAWLDPDDWIEGLLQELTEFDHGTYDDQVDAFTQALRWLDIHAESFGRSAIVTDERLFGRR